MDPQRSLTLLAARKAVLRTNIAARRRQCAADAARVAQPLEWLDRALALWRQIPPLAKAMAFPLGLIAIKRTFYNRYGKILGPLLRWGPLILNAMRGIRSPAKIRSTPFAVSKTHE